MNIMAETLEDVLEHGIWRTARTRIKNGFGSVRGASRRCHFTIRRALRGGRCCTHTTASAFTAGFAVPVATTSFTLTAHSRQDQKSNIGARLMQDTRVTSTNASLFGGWMSACLLVARCRAAHAPPRACSPRFITTRSDARAASRRLLSATISLRINARGICCRFNKHKL